jgi:hypothetical protein
MDTRDLISKVNAHNKTINESAKKLRAIMVECGIGSLKAGKVLVVVHDIQSSVGGDDFLMMHIEGDSYNNDIFVALECSASATRNESFLHGDFSAAYSHPSRGDLLEFNSALPSLLAEIEATCKDACAELGEKEAE